MFKKDTEIFWLALQRAVSTFPLAAKMLLDKYQTPSNIFKAVRNLADENAAIRALKDFSDWKKCEDDFKRCQKEGVDLITLDDERYPALLKEIPDPPLVLMTKGEQRDILSGPCISIVGSRKASQHGREVAFELAQGLAEKGIKVVSGMAYGIDAAAHQGAMSAGSTIAVWGSGIDVCYPAAFKDLSLKIMKCGCVISEFPFSTPPHKSNFPQRNRIISGLSLGVVIVEAAEKSGSLITARFALDHGREVFAVPGPAGGALSCGTHDLLRNGAAFAERASDIFDQIEPQLPQIFKNPRHLPDNDNNGHPLLAYIPFGKGVLLDMIVQSCGMSASSVMKDITFLTLEGLIEEMAGKRYRRKK